MPSEKGFPANGGVANARVPTAPMTVTDAAKEPPVFSSVLRLILWSQSPVMPMTPFLVDAVHSFLIGRHGARIPLGGEAPHPPARYLRKNAWAVRPTRSQAPMATQPSISWP